MTLNERIAKVKGWDVYRHGPDVFGVPPKYHNDEGVNPRSRDWSGSIADAWELVEELRLSGREFNLFADESAMHLWIFECWAGEHGNGISATGNAPTAPEAICLAYLAVMEDK